MSGIQPGICPKCHDSKNTYVAADMSEGCHMCDLREEMERLKKDRAKALKRASEIIASVSEELHVAEKERDALRDEVDTLRRQHEAQRADAEKMRAEVERLNGALRVLVVSAREAGADAIADLIAALLREK